MVIGHEGVSTANPMAFIGIQEDDYWSSNSQASASVTEYAVYFGPSDGTINSVKSNAYYVWPVREARRLPATLYITLFLRYERQRSIRPASADLVVASLVLSLAIFPAGRSV